MIDLASLLQRIREADALIRPDVLVTPLEHSTMLSRELDCDVWLKCDHQQPTGSFKIRGATHRVTRLTDAERAHGIVTSSTGNHGQATARAGSRAGIDVKVFVSSQSSRMKLEAIRALGAELVVNDCSVLDAELMARRYAEDEGWTYISPYNDRDVIAGQGTLGLELVRQLPDFDAAFISVGCGGLMGGAGTAIKQLAPKATVFGAWPERSTAMLRSLEAGRIVTTKDEPTLADGSAGAIEEGSLTFPICQAVVDRTTTVSEAEIASAMRRVAETDRWIIEGAAGVAVAGLLKHSHEMRGKRVAVVLCGRNVLLETFRRVMGTADERDLDENSDQGDHRCAM